MKALFLSQLTGTLKTLWSGELGRAPGEPGPTCSRSVPCPCTCASRAAWPLCQVDPCFLLSVHSKTVLFLNVSDTGRETVWARV